MPKENEKKEREKCKQLVGDRNVELARYRQALGYAMDRLNPTQIVEVQKILRGKNSK